MRRLVGALDGPRVPLRARWGKRAAFPQYVRTAVAFRSAPGVEVVGWWLVPRRFRAPGPAILCLPGHGRGVDSIVGIDAKGRQRPWGRWGEYQADFALQAVAHGYAVLAIEQLAFGRRRDARARRQGPDASSCQVMSGTALMEGVSMTGWRVRDAMAAVTWLRTRPEVDPGRIAVMGISGGGLTALFTAALDRRVAAAVVSGYLNYFRTSIMAIPHCIDNFIPGLVRVAEMPDVAGLIAPRPLFAESGTRDDIFPVAAARSAFARATRVYRVLGVPRACGLEIFPGIHQFSGRAAFTFLARALRGGTAPTR